MDKNWLGNIEWVRARDLSNKRVLAGLVDSLREQNYSYSEIQALLRSAGHDIDTNTIRTASSK